MEPESVKASGRVAAEAVRGSNLFPLKRYGLFATLVLALTISIAFALVAYSNAGSLLFACLMAIAQTAGTAAATYFLLRRDERRRERTVDRVLLESAAYAEDLAFRFIGERSELDALELELLQAVAGSSPDKSPLHVSPAELPNWITRHIDAGSYLEAGLHQISEVWEVLQHGVLLLGSAPPALASAYVTLVDRIEGPLLGILPDLRVGLRGWNRLLILSQQNKDLPEARRSIVDSVEAVAEGLEALHIGGVRELMRFLREDMTEFAAELSPGRRRIYEETRLVHLRSRKEDGIRDLDPVKYKDE